jgi:hypothetical protein
MGYGKVHGLENEGKLFFNLIFLKAKVCGKIKHFVRTIQKRREDFSRK